MKSKHICDHIGENRLVSDKKNQSFSLYLCYLLRQLMMPSSKFEANPVATSSSKMLFFH